MNRINPDKLLLSKWSAVEPIGKQRHFIVTKLIRNDSGNVITCEIEAVLTNKVSCIDWRELKNSDAWLMGWK